MNKLSAIRKTAGIFLCASLLMTGCGQKSSDKSETVKKETFKIGITQITDHPSLDNCREGFIEGLKSKGFIDGNNIEIDFKSAQNDQALATQIAQNFAASKDLVCGISTPSAQTLYAVCLEKKIPVIFNAISDPVSAKLAKSEKEPAEGITGVSDRLPVEDQLKLIRELLPDAEKIGILYTTSEDNSVSTLQTYKDLAGKYGFEIVEKGIGTEAEISQAIDVLVNQVDCVSNMTDNTVVNNLALLIQKAGGKNVPVFGSEEEQVKNGCIASAGLDYYALGVQAGEMAANVLGGEDIKNIPFETMKDTKFTVNEKVAAKYAVPLDGEIASNADIIR